MSSNSGDHQAKPANVFLVYANEQLRMIRHMNPLALSLTLVAVGLSTYTQPTLELAGVSIFYLLTGYAITSATPEAHSSRAGPALVSVIALSLGWTAMSCDPRVSMWTVFIVAVVKLGCCFLAYRFWGTIKEMALYAGGAKGSGRTTGQESGRTMGQESGRTMGHLRISRGHVLELVKYAIAFAVPALALESTRLGATLTVRIPTIAINVAIFCVAAYAIVKLPAPTTGPGIPFVIFTALAWAVAVFTLGAPIWLGVVGVCAILAYGLDAVGDALWRWTERVRKRVQCHIEVEKELAESDIDFSYHPLARGASTPAAADGFIMRMPCTWAEGGE